MRANKVDKPWQPDPDKVQMMKSEIEEMYRKFKKPMPPAGVEVAIWEQTLEAWARMGAFLMDSKAVVRQLRKINDYLHGKLIPELPEIDVVTLPAEGEKGRAQVLRQLLEKGLATIGFAPKFAKAFDFLAPDTFFKALKGGWMIKDTVFRRLPHGELPHAEQAFALLLQQKESKFLGEDDKILANAIKAMGGTWAIMDKTLTANVWILVFDQLKTPVSDEYPMGISYDFRSPENLTRFIRGRYDEKIENGKTALEEGLDLLQKLSLERADKKAEKLGESKIDETTGKKRGTSYDLSTRDDKIVMPTEEELTTKKRPR
jgi:hypothetical protein